MNKYQEKMEALNYYNVLGDAAPKSNEADIISEFEKLIANKLPLEYGEFLLNYNCIAFDGYVVFPTPEVYPKGKSSMVDILFGFLPGDTYSLDENYYCYRGRMPSDLVPIASDPGGNIVCIAISGDFKGMIYFWDHEDEEVFDDGHCNDKNIYLIAKSFDEFIDSLEKCFIDEDD